MPYHAPCKGSSSSRSSSGDCEARGTAASVQRSLWRDTVLSQGQVIHLSRHVRSCRLSWIDKGTGSRTAGLVLARGQVELGGAPRASAGRAAAAETRGTCTARRDALAPSPQNLLSSGSRPAFGRLLSFRIKTFKLRQPSPIRSREVPSLWRDFPQPLAGCRFLGTWD